MKYEDFLKTVGIKHFIAMIGRSSSGKTTAAASFPKPFLELDFDYRANGIINAINQGWLKPDLIDIVQFDRLKGYIPVQDKINALYQLAALPGFPFASIDVGSGSSLVRLLDLTTLSLPPGTKGIQHMNIAGLAMSGAADYRFENQAFHKILSYLKMLPCHVTIAFHIVNNWGKAPGAKEYDPAMIIGEKLTLTGNLAETVLAEFNDVYKFTKDVSTGNDRYYVEFVSETARNSFGLPSGRFDITGISFWDFLNKLIQEIKDGSFRKDNYIKSAQPTGGFGA